MKRDEIAFNVLRLPLDFGLLLIAGGLTYIIRTQLLDAWRPVQFAVNVPPGRFAGLVLAASALIVLAYAVSGLYTMRRRMSSTAETARIVVASSGAMMVALLVMFLRATLFDSRFLVLGYWGLAIILVTVGRFAMRRLGIWLMVRAGLGAQRILLIGDDGTADRILRLLGRDPGLGYRVVERLAGPRLEGVAHAVDRYAVDEVVLTHPNHPAEQIVELVHFCHDRHILFTFVPNIHETLTMHWDMDEIGHTPVLTLRRTALNGWGRVFKRVVDVISSSIALILLSPLLAIIAFAIKWETAGPVFVRLRRVSGTQQFNLLKFRSMIENAEELKPLLATLNERADGPLFKMRNDPRVTGVGRFIRRTRLDELPQFLNVLMGDISLVGPRPHQPDEIARYTRHHRNVLAIKAGATGMAQVSGSSDLPFEQEVELDTYYIEHWSLGLDLRIALRTMLRMLTDRSAV